MEGETPREAGRTAATAQARRWRDAYSLLVLLLLAAGLRTWLFCHTAVAARDSIGFIRIAWLLRHQPWADVLRHSEQHPGYPVLLLLVSYPVRLLLHGPEALVMQFSAQLTSVLAGTLLVVPMFYLGRELFGRTAGFWASVLFQVLPASCRVLSDGLSEATFLLFAATALYLAVRGLRTRSPGTFALCGLFGALAYLTRPEGALIVGLTGVVLLAAQFVPAWRRSWGRCAACTASLALATAVAGSPIPLATGKLALKPTVGNIDHPFREHHKRVGPAADERNAPGEGDFGALPAGQPVFASLLAVWWLDPPGPHRYGYIVWGLWAVGFELNKGFHYATWISALLGLWLFRERFRRVPGNWVLLLLSGAIILLLWRVAAVMGYLSDRHTLLVLLCGVYCAAAALAALGERAANFLRARAPALLLRLMPRRLGRLVMVGLLVALVGSALPKALEAPHLSRTGFRAAGLWLAEHAQPADVIFDPYSWSDYYAGRTFQDVEPPPPGYTPLEYVVLDRSVHEKRPDSHPHLSKHQQAKKLARLGREVYHISGHHRKETFDIAVYALPAPLHP
jgi:4-amino-4-deoxy-L-arabinose transferase-like glycosyltransferase